jgi:ABC-type Fe3+/spermidine/putrescine transport system ATPase subunit
MGEIKFNNVTKSFGDIKAVNNANFTVHDGEFLTLLGPSGCGKSTTLNLIAGMLSPTKGEIKLNGEVINDIPCNKRNIGLVFQSYALFPHMTVFDNVAFGLRMKKFTPKMIPDKVKEALRLVNMIGYEDRKPAELSGGQQQRIALARALVFDPEVLLLDEPLSNLDAKLRESVGFELKQLHETTKKTIIYVTHDQIEALTMSDRIILMNQGEIEQEGSPYDLYSTPKTLFAADFIGSNSFIKCEVEKADSEYVKIKFGERFSVVAKNINHTRFKENQHVTLAIRPENIQLIDEEDSQLFKNILSGSLINNVFRGSNVLLYIDIEGNIIKVETSSENYGRIEKNKNKPIVIGFNECIVF